MVRNRSEMLWQTFWRNDKAVRIETIGRSTLAPRRTRHIRDEMLTKVFVSGEKVCERAWQRGLRAENDVLSRSSPHLTLGKKIDIGCFAVFKARCDSGYERVPNCKLRA